VRTLVVAASLLGAAVYLSEASRAEEVPPRESLASLPLNIDDWMGRREADLTPDIIAVLGVDDYIVRSYAQAGEPALGLYIGYHSSQRQGDAIHSPLNCLPGAGWQPIEQGRIVIPVRNTPGSSSTTPVEVNRVVIGKGLDRQLVLYWYQSHRRVVASEYWGKVYTVLDSVRYNRTDAAMVRIVVPIPDSRPLTAVEERGVAFAQALFPLLSRHLPS
jgi:EpsI family protein